MGASTSSEAEDDSERVLAALQAGMRAAAVIVDGCAYIPKGRTPARQRAGAVTPDARLADAHSARHTAPGATARGCNIGLLVYSTSTRPLFGSMYPPAPRSRMPRHLRDPQYSGNEKFAAADSIRKTRETSGKKDYHCMIYMCIYVWGGK